MKRWFAILCMVVLSCLVLYGCGDDSSSSSQDFQDLVGDNGGGGGPLPPGAVGELGELIDLGDLVQPEGDRWYFTQSRAINDNGMIVGRSNNNGVESWGAFLWDPDTADPLEDMTFLGIDPENGIDPERLYSESVDINDSNEAIVHSFGTFDGDPEYGICGVWREGEGLVLIPGLEQCKVNDINELGEIVGGNKCDPTCEEPFYWDGVSAETRSVGSLFGADDAEAVAINENFQVIINSGGSAVFHDLNHNVVEILNFLPGADTTVAVDINDSAFTNNDGIPDGHVIGNSGNFGPEDLTAQTDPIWHFEDESKLLIGLEGLDIHGFFWDGGAMYPISDLGGGASAVTDINNQDQVVGGALTEDGSTHAILWTLDENKKGVVQDLGTLGGDHSFALSINENGQIVGWSYTGEFYTENGFNEPIIHGFLWDNGTMYDLGTHDDFYDFAFTPPYPHSSAVDINELGELTGNSTPINVHPRGFYLDPDLPIQ